MPTVDLEEAVSQTTTADPTLASDTTPDTGDDTPTPGSTEGADSADGADDAALTRGLEGLDPTMEGAAVTTPVAEGPPDGVTVDDKGRWRQADGTFAPKQPNVEAAQSAREERAALQRVAEYKAKGLDERGNKPWTPNVFGKEMPLIPGALDKPGVGILIPESGRAALTMLTARGHRWPEIQAQRQEHAAAIQREQERTSYYSEQFTQIVKDTLLNPEWMAWASTDPQTFSTAKMQVETRLRSATVDATQRFGAIPAKGDSTATTGEGLDLYEATGAITDYLDELIGSDQTFAGLDKNAVVAELTRQRVPVFTDHPEHGPLLDTRPVRIIAENIALRNRATARPAVDPAAGRNAAAVATTTPRKPVGAAPARPKATTTPADQKQDPRYEGREQDNPALSLDERRAAYYKNLGIRQPG